jgi:thiamine pyrophosphate-dependent acetolactate synthase large subunit-like protein
VASRSGRFALIEQFVADGFTHMFGNPGTVEQGFLDALADFPQLQYVLTLQESIAVLVADGYARASRQPALVQIHSSPGVGNAIGNLYQAKRGGTPLVVIAGESGIKYDAMDAQMAADLVAMARPVTKWATRIVDPESMLRVIRRAIKVATTPPTGPVFVCLPADILDAPNDEQVFPSGRVSTRVGPEAEEVARVATMLGAAERPIVIMGDGICTSDAQAELAHVAELIGADVWGANSSEVNISSAHPLYRGSLGHMWGHRSAPITSQADVVLISGTYVLPEVFPAMQGVFAPGAKVIHIELDPYEIGKNFPVDIGILADPKTTLGLVAAQLESAMTDGQRQHGRDRLKRIGGETDAERGTGRTTDAAVAHAVPMTAAPFVRELAAQIPAGSLIFDEALTSSPEVTRYLPPIAPGTFFQTRGGSLGVGFPGAIGLKLAYPDKTVVGFSGDGGCMYTIQSLWTAAHHRVGAKFVVCNNRSYKLLKQNVQQYWRDLDLPEREFPSSFDIHDPDIQFVDLARGMGVPGVRVETPDQIAGAVREMLATDGPFLVDLIIGSEIPSHVVCPETGP